MLLTPVPGFKSLAVDQVTPFFDVAFAKGAIAKNQFQFYMDSVDGSGVVLGGINTKYFSGPLQQVPLTHETYFVVDVQSMLVGTTDLDECLFGMCPCYLLTSLFSLLSITCIPHTTYLSILQDAKLSLIPAPR